jgi:hypothetical protein
MSSTVPRNHEELASMEHLFGIAQKGVAKKARGTVFYLF